MKGAKLPDEIVHNLELGKLRMWALFSKAPLKINTIEQTVKRLSSKELFSLKRLPLKHVGQQTFEFTVKQLD